MYYLRDVHKIIGRNEAEFEAAYRDVWMPKVAQNDEARFLWYCKVAHGAGFSYRVVTITAVRDAASWERLAKRMQRGGDLWDFVKRTHLMRYESSGELLAPLAWSPAPAADFAAIPTTPGRRTLGLYVEDTVWPPPDVDGWVRAAGAKLAEGRKDDPSPMTELALAMRPVYGGGHRREVVLLQRVINNDRLGDFYSTGQPSGGAPWAGLGEKLALGDRWESRILRSMSWSPIQ